MKAIEECTQPGIFLYQANFKFLNQFCWELIDENDENQKK